MNTPYILHRIVMPHGGREEERQAALALVRRVFGPDAIIGHTPAGAPVVERAETSGRHISISHSDIECVLAVADVPVGVDVEVPRAQLVRVSGKFLSKNERVELTPEALLPYWTAKEAVYKAAGIHGLGLVEIEVNPLCGTAMARGRIFSISYTENSHGLEAVAVEKSL